MSSSQHISSLFGLFSLFSVWLSFPAAAFGQSHGYFINSDTNSYDVGAPIYITQRWISPAESPLDIPPLPDTLLALEKIDEQELQEDVRDGKLIRIRKSTYICFDSAYVRIPVQRFSFLSGGDSIHLETSRLFLDVKHVPLEESEELKPIEPPMEVGYSLSEFRLILFIAIALAVIIAFLLWLRMRQKETVEKEKPARPAYIIAFERLEELRAQKLWQAGQLKEYHSLISEIVREYIEGRFKLPALESTTDELQAALKETSITKELRAELISMLRLSDFVKFAKGNALPDENERAWELAYRLVKDTMMVEPAKTDESDAA